MIHELRDQEKGKPILAEDLRAQVAAIRHLQGTTWAGEVSATNGPGGQTVFVAPRIQAAICELTTGTPDADGYYTGFRLAWNPTDGVYQFEECLVIKL